MRYNQFLLEYDEAKMAARYGGALFQKLNSQRYSEPVNGLLDDCWDRAWGAVNPGMGQETPEERTAMEAARNQFVVGRFSQFDPTPNKQYMSWIVTRYVSGGIQRLEDLHRVRDYLTQYAAVRQSGFFKRHPDQNALYGDIGRFKTLSDLGDFVLSLKSGDTVSNAEAERQKERLLFDSGDAKLFFDNGDWKVVIPKTAEASIFFGRNTQWCTAATESDNMFEDYAKDGPLYIILHKPTNRRWQFHFETGQFMDERDQPIFWGDFPNEFFDLDLFKYYSLPFHAKMTLLSSYAPVEIRKIILEMDKEEYAVLLLNIYVFGNNDWHIAVNRNTIMTHAKDFETELDVTDYSDADGTVLLSVTEHNWADLVIVVAEEIGHLSTFKERLKPIFNTHSMRRELEPDDAHKWFSGSYVRGFADIAPEGMKSSTQTFLRKSSSDIFLVAGAAHFPETMSVKTLRDRAALKATDDEAWMPNVLMARAMLKDHDR